MAKYGAESFWKARFTVGPGPPDRKSESSRVVDEAALLIMVLNDDSI
jgi:hypothetical protein